MKIILYTILIFIFSSCASLTQGTSDAFLITSKPNNVEIKTSHGYFCIAPCALKLPKKDSFTVSAEKKGYCSRVIMLSQLLVVLEVLHLQVMYLLEV